METQHYNHPEEQLVVYLNLFQGDYGQARRIKVDNFDNSQIIKRKALPIYIRQEV